MGGPGRSIAEHRLGALLAALVLGLTLALMSPGTAAFAGGDAIEMPTKDPTGGSTVTLHRCVLYANTHSFGADCAGGGPGVTVTDLLRGAKFPECRFEPLPSDVTAPTTHKGEKGAWYLKSCLQGIKDDGTGDFTYTIEFKWVPEGTPVPVLTQDQKNAWNTFQSSYPRPVPQFGPATLPRVLIPTYFWLTHTSGDTIEHTVFDGTRQVLMRAHVEQLVITPGGYHDDRTFTCPEPVPAYDRSQGIFQQESGCSYDYKRSSAVMADKTFDVIVEADWIVEYQLADGTMKQLGRFPRVEALKTPVDEIQAVVGG